MSEQTQKRLLMVGLVIWCVFVAGFLLGMSLPATEPQPLPQAAASVPALVPAVDVATAMVNGIGWAELTPLTAEEEEVGWQSLASYPLEQSQPSAEELLAGVLSKNLTNRRLTDFMTGYSWRLELAPVQCRSRAEVVLLPQTWQPGPVDPYHQLDEAALRCQQWVGRFLLTQIERGDYGVIVGDRPVDIINESSMTRLMWQSDNDTWSTSVAAYDASMMLALTRPNLTVIGEGEIVKLDGLCCRRQPKTDRDYEMRQAVARIRDRVVASRAVRLLNDQNMPVMVLIDEKRVVPIRAQLSAWGVRNRVWTPPSMGVATAGDRWA